MQTSSDVKSINHYLQSRGFGKISDPGTIPQLGYMVKDHNHFRRLLFSCDPTMRKQMYESMAPHLRFTAKPLDVYEAEAKDEANRRQLPSIDENGKLVGYDEFIPGGKVNPIDRLAEKAIKAREAELAAMCKKCGKMVCSCENHEGEVMPLEKFAERAIHDDFAFEKSGQHTFHVVCHKCTAEASFVGATLASAAIEARRAGWVYQEIDGEGVEVCPKCPSPRMTKAGNA